MNHLKNHDINQLMDEFIKYFLSLSENDFQDFMDYFVHNKISARIALLLENYGRIDQKYDFFATRAFLRALDIRI